MAPTTIDASATSRVSLATTRPPSRASGNQQPTGGGVAGEVEWVLLDEKWRAVHDSAMGRNLGEFGRQPG